MEKNVTRLENLPNEVLLTIARFLTARELHQSFFGLNRRFLSIIQSITDLDLTITEVTVKLPICLSFSHVIKLTIEFVRVIDLRPFSNLRSLKWIRPSNEQLNRLVSNNPCPHLEYLSIFDVLHTPSYARLQRMIFSDGFPRLHTCHLSGLCTLAGGSTVSPVLQTLTIGSVLTNDILRDVLRACPSLTRLALQIDPDRSHTHGIPVQHVNLLKLHLNGRTNEARIETMLQIFPNLTDLKIKATIVDQASNFLPRLNLLLSTYLLALERFRFQLILTDWYRTLTEQIAHTEHYHPALRKGIQWKDLGYGRAQISNY